MAQALEFTYKLLQVIRNTVGILVLVIIFYILQYIFNMHFVCSCKSGLHLNGMLYLVLPPFILTFIVNIVEPFHQRKICYPCKTFKRCCSCLGSYFSKLFFMFLSLGSIWLAAVLFDGDWFVCLMTNLNTTQTGIPCKKQLTYEEQRLIGEYMTQSLVCGLFLICIFLFVWSTFEIRRFSCRTRLLRPYYSVVFKDLLAEEVGMHLNNRLKEIAIKKANAVCAPYLTVIENDEVPGDEKGDGDITASDAWEKISMPGFHLMEEE